MRRTVALLACLCLLRVPASALVGDASTADAVIRRHTVMVYSSHGGCSGAVVAQDLVLTAAHCARDESVFQIAGFIAGAPFRLSDVSQVALHPMKTDLALLKLGKPLPTGFAPAFLTVRPVAVGDRAIVVGYGVSAPGDAKSFGTARMAALIVQARSNDSITLRDPRDPEYLEGGGLAGGACNGDSGAPVFTLRGAPLLVGIVSGGWCGSDTFATPLAPHWDWLMETARSSGSPLIP